MQPQVSPWVALVRQQLANLDARDKAAAVAALPAVAEASGSAIILAVGEDTGAMDTMLHKLSDFYDQEVEATTEALTALIEPLMIAFLGGMVGSMIVALYMPIFKVFDLIVAIGSRFDDRIRGFALPFGYRRHFTPGVVADIRQIDDAVAQLPLPHRVGGRIKHAAAGVDGRLAVVQHHLARHQLGRLDAWVLVEPSLHRVAVEHVVERHERHALVVRHVVAHQHAARLLDCRQKLAAARHSRRDCDSDIGGGRRARPAR